MLVVDSSVWIANFRGLDTPAVRKLTQAGPASDLLVGDIVLLEVLQGARDPGHALRIERMLRAFDVVPMLDADLAVEAAANYRLLRSLGITIRKTPDLIIGTYCIEHGHKLLHDDRDFEPMRVHLGLQVV
ncbi:MAG: PIN domain nuclease [Acetobacteraceae bacterium]|jgi:predicted nucleic acid-binding protein